MGQQLNKVEKRRRRANYLKRLKSRAAAGVLPVKKRVAKSADADGDAKKKTAKKKVVKKKAPAKSPVEASPEVATETAAPGVQENRAPESEA